MEMLFTIRAVRLSQSVVAAVLSVVLIATVLNARENGDDKAIRNILDDEVATWNRADTDGYSRHFAKDGTFTNIRGMFFTGHQEFRDRHEVIFTGMFRGTVLKQDIVSLRFIRPDVAIAETLTSVSGFSKTGPPPSIFVDAKGRLRTRLLQVLRKDKDGWKIVVYHNVDIKPGVSVPEAR